MTKRKAVEAEKQRAPRGVARHVMTLRLDEEVWDRVVTRAVRAGHTVAVEIDALLRAALGKRRADR